MARYEIAYEWKRETIDPRDPVRDMLSDIVDYEHADPGELYLLWPPGPQQRICLVRDVGNNEEGLVSRDHAYVVDDRLAPVTHEEQRHVPQCFHDELAGVLAR